MPIATAQQPKLKRLDAFAAAPAADPCPAALHRLPGQEPGPNGFRIPGLNEELRVRVFAELEP